MTPWRYWMRSAMGLSGALDALSLQIHEQSTALSRCFAISESAAAWYTITKMETLSDSVEDLLHIGLHARRA